MFYTTNEQDIRSESGGAKPFLWAPKPITTFAFAMISRMINGFELGDLKVRKGENGIYAASFLCLWGFGGGFEEGVCPNWKA